ncbi:unnamed protein product [Soboliphyme baturini]|uniref:Uncharacterized protein n=1 Tax=Soboliphyme baturini TaxID=241478 RepID=A0A183IDH3_9BILA|nr:unnamed protein product [Soboliphyme baturini]
MNPVAALDRVNSLQLQQQRAAASEDSDHRAAVWLLRADDWQRFSWSSSTTRPEPTRSDAALFDKPTIYYRTPPVTDMLAVTSSIGLHGSLPVVLLSIDCRQIKEHHRG